MIRVSYPTDAESEFVDDQSGVNNETNIFSSGALQNIGLIYPATLAIDLDGIMISYSYALGGD